MPRVLILWADDRSSNLGVRVLGEGTAAIVRSVWPDADVVHNNFGSRTPQLPTGRVRTLLRERVQNRRGMMAWLAEFDLVVDTRAGDSFTDIYGGKRLAVMSLISEFATQAGVPVVLGPQTIGPFTTIAGRLAARRSLKRAARVMARDSVSAEYAASLGRPVDILTSDVVFALPVPDVPRSRDVLLNVSGLLWDENPHVDHLRYRRIVAEVHHSLVAAGREVTLFAHVISSGRADDDVPALNAFAATLPTAPEVLVPADLAAAREAVASAQVVIGSRMHACLNALSTGTPAVAMAYSRKFAPLLSDLGWGATVDLTTGAATAEQVTAYATDTAMADDVVHVAARARATLKLAEDALRELL